MEDLVISFKDKYFKTMADLFEFISDHFRPIARTWDSNKIRVRLKEYIPRERIVYEFEEVGRRASK